MLRKLEALDSGVIYLVDYVIDTSFRLGKYSALSVAVTGSLIFNEYVGLSKTSPKVLPAKLAFPIRYFRDCSATDGSWFRYSFGEFSGR